LPIAQPLISESNFLKYFRAEGIIVEQRSWVNEEKTAIVEDFRYHESAFEDTPMTGVGSRVQHRLVY
jgi:hypothetical protein